jgi:uncharacterized SAM-binding protein YcdF (DUF218 family)
LLLAGGRRQDGRTEAEAMAAEAFRLAVPADRLWLEQESCTTWENAEKVAVLLKKWGVTSAVVVTSDYHLPRARFVFRQVCGEVSVIVGYVGAPSDPSAYRRGRMQEWVKWPCNGLEALIRAVARWLSGMPTRPAKERSSCDGQSDRPGRRGASAGGDQRQLGVSGAGAAHRAD